MREIMKLEPDELEKLFFEQFPAAFWKETCTVMVSAYKEAARAIKTAGLHKDLAAWEHNGGDARLAGPTAREQQ
jgi:hypothetical protein